MIFNNESFEVNVEANYGYFIEISDKSGKNKVVLSFTPDHKDLKNLNINERVFVTDEFFSDTSVIDEEGYCVLDISDINIYLTRLDDNLFRLELGVKNPYIMYTVPEGKTLDYLGVNVEFSFNYDYKPTPDYEILNKGTKIHTQEELNEVLDKL